VAHTKIFLDKFGQTIRLTPERLLHIQEHPEMLEFIDDLSRVLLEPEAVIQSQSDEAARLYYLWLTETKVSENICVSW
jgi:hypothetical protein